MNEEENERLKNTFMTYFNYFVYNASLAIRSSNADKNVKERYNRLLSDIINDVYEFVNFKKESIKNQ